MFSGIIKSVGKIESIEQNGSTRVLIISSPISETLKVDQSVSHDGACLTIVKVENGTHVVEVVNETILKSTLGLAIDGQILNLEKSISSNTLLDGHLVQGHVDTIIKCLSVDDLNGSWKMIFNLPDAFAGLIIPQGSICINGVSLTVSDLFKDSFAVAIIPYTYQNTNFKNLKEDTPVNVEFDVIGKYIIRQMELRSLTE